jgi:hypothetical protein
VRQHSTRQRGGSAQTGCTAAIGFERNQGGRAGMQGRNLSMTCMGACCGSS